MGLLIREEYNEEIICKTPWLRAGHNQRHTWSRDRTPSTFWTCFLRKFKASSEATRIPSQSPYPPNSQPTYVKIPHSFYELSGIEPIVCRMRGALSGDTLEHQKQTHTSKRSQQQKQYFSVMGRGCFFNNGTGSTGRTVRKKGIVTPIWTKHKNQFQINYRPKYESSNNKAFFFFLRKT